MRESEIKREIERKERDVHDSEGGGFNLMLKEYVVWSFIQFIE
jgi:hypothetical protein